MAINTAAKRISALIEPWGTLPVPDGSLSMRDRATLLGQYRGAVAIADVRRAGLRVVEVYYGLEPEDG